MPNDFNKNPFEHNMGDINLYLLKQTPEILHSSTVLPTLESATLSTYRMTD